MPKRGRIRISSFRFRRFSASRSIASSTGYFRMASKYSSPCAWFIIWPIEVLGSSCLSIFWTSSMPSASLRSSRLSSMLKMNSICNNSGKLQRMTTLGESASAGEASCPLLIPHGNESWWPPRVSSSGDKHGGRKRLLVVFWDSPCRAAWGFSKSGEMSALPQNFPTTTDTSWSWSML